MRARQKPKSPRRTRGLTKIKKTEITRVARGVLAAGLTLRGFDVDPISGKLSVLVGQPAEGNDLDQWIAMRKKNADQT